MSEQDHLASQSLGELAQRQRNLVIGMPARFSFSVALDLMKQGCKVQRAGWNGKNMWICLGAGQTIADPDKFWNKHTRAFAHERASRGMATEVAPYFIMKTADNKIVMGWLASQTDLAAEDWMTCHDEFPRDNVPR